MTKQVKVVAVLTARPGKADALETLLLGMTTPSRAEPGCLRYDLWRDQADPIRFVLDELYVDNLAVTAHRETPHFKAYLEIIAELAERSAFVVDPIRVA